jgi:hypothetical protein
MLTNLALEKSGVDRKKKIDTPVSCNPSERVIPTGMPDAVYMPDIYLLMRHEDSVSGERHKMNGPGH